MMNVNRCQNCTLFHWHSATFIPNLAYKESLAPLCKLLTEQHGIECCTAQFRVASKGLLCFVCSAFVWWGPCLYCSFWIAEKEKILHYKAIWTHNNKVKKKTVKLLGFIVLVWLMTWPNMIILTSSLFQKHTITHTVRQHIIQCRTCQVPITKNCAMAVELNWKIKQKLFTKK